MSAPNGPGPSSSERIRVEGDDDEVRYPFSMVGDWVTLSSISDRAFRVYAVLRAHVNIARGDDEAWPSQDDIATVLGLSKGDHVREAIRELIEIGAVTARTVPGRNGRYTTYKVRRERPDDDWPGPRRSSDLYEPGVLAAMKDERVTKRPYQVGRKPAGAKAK